MAGDRFDKFTERARKVLQYAQEEAQRLNHNYIGTEHILLGLVRVEDGLAAKTLTELGASLDKVRSATETIIGRGDKPVTADIGLTPRAKKVIELSVDEARRLGNHYIGTEHLLLGLVREGEGIAAGVLESLGISLDKARSRVLFLIDNPDATASRAAEAPTVERQEAAAAVPARWEYLEVRVTAAGWTDSNGNSGSLETGTEVALLDVLSWYGENGWELAWGTDEADGALRLYFKRPTR